MSWGSREKVVEWRIKRGKKQTEGDQTRDGRTSRWVMEKVGEKDKEITVYW